MENVSLKKIVIGIVAAVAVGALGYFGAANLDLFRAEITAVPGQVAKGALYIPDYTGAPGDEGVVEILTRDPIVGVYGLSFTVQYNPQQITFPNDPVVLTGTPLSGFFVQANTAVAGQLTVLIVGSDPANVEAGARLASLRLQISNAVAFGANISLTPANVEVSVDQAGAPAISPTLREIAAGRITIQNNGRLQALYAEAIDPTHVVVHFSDFLRNVSELPGQWTVAPALGIANVEIGTDQRSVMITVNAPMGAGTVYALTLAADAATGNIQGAVADGFRRLPFVGFQDPAGLSPVQMESVEVLSATQVRVRFTGDVAAPTLTPVNFLLHTADTVTTNTPALNVSDVAVENNRTVLLSMNTTRQRPGTNYFIRINGVRDAANLTLGAGRLLNFIGFRAPLPTVQTVTPDNLVNNAEGTLTIRGSGLSRVAVVRVGTNEARIISQTDQQIEAGVSANLAVGLYNLILTDVEGETVTVQGAVLISAPEERMRVISEESKAIPHRVPNDGATKTALWVLVEDPRDVDNVERVTIDLSQIGGAPAQVMTPSPDNKTDRRQWFKFETTVPATVATRAEPYLLPVTVKNRSQAAEARGTASVIVTRDVQASVPPVIEQGYVSPLGVPPDGKTTAKVSVRVSDPDGIGTVVSVVADLGQVGGGFVALKTTAAPGGAVAGELVTGWFVSDPFTVPATTPVGDYKIMLTASDSSGATVSQEIDFSVSATLSGPTIDATQSYIGPRNAVAKTGNAAFSVHAFVSDPDTLADITSVIVNLRGIGGGPTPLTRDASSPETARAGWFSAESLRVASTTPFGIQTLEVVATDKSGARSSVTLQLNVTEEETLGDSPRVKSDKSYTTPRVAINDGQTKVTLYAFITDDDDDVKTVVAKLGNIGRVGGEAPQALARRESPSAEVQPAAEEAAGAAPPPAVTAGECPTQGVIVCMQPSVKEGVEGQWYILPDVIVSPDTAASSDPYPVEVIVSDDTGKTGRGTIPVYVNDGASYTNDRQPPEVVLAVATGSASVEVLFSEEIDATTISADGKEFTITDRNNIQQPLAIQGAVISATGTIVTLTTEPQEPGKYYMLSANSKIRDAVGIPLVTGGKSRVSLLGFEGKNQPPVVEYINTSDVDTIEVEFRDYLKPSSLVLTPNQPAPEGTQQDRLRPRLRGGHDLNVEVYESEGGSEQVPVKSVQFGDEANVLIIQTDPLAAGKRYRVNFKNLASFDGVSALKSVNKMVKGFKGTVAASGALEKKADLNGDGKVDFLDFTMFSAVYGEGAAAASSAAQPKPPAPCGPDSPPSCGLSPQPIEPKPDSTESHTSSASPAKAEPNAFFSQSPQQ